MYTVKLWLFPVSNTALPFKCREYLAFAGGYWLSNVYKVGGAQDVGLEVAFGSNFADDHIKGYDTGLYFDGRTYTGLVAGMFVCCVRGDENVYGINDFTDNKGSTVTGNAATNLMW